MRLFLSLFIFLTTNAFSSNLPLNLLKLPPGFSINVFATVPNAREMILGDKGTIFVGSKEAGNVYAVIPDKTKPEGTRVLIIAAGLTEPNGVAFRQGSLYVAERTRMLRFDDIEDHLEHPPRPIVVNDTLPNQTIHSWHYIKFGPDEKLYIGMGAPCNICLSKDPRSATIMRMKPDGSDFEIFSKGVRNSVGFDWNPVTNDLWFTDNGRDWMGDNLPPDKVNVAPKPGMNFGFPYFHGKNVPDPKFGKNHQASEFTLPALELPAHVAPLGLLFYTGNMFPAEYQNNIFIAEHGSWNRSKKIGYQVMFLKLQGNKIVDVKPFVTGWLQGQNAWGRPVAFLTLPDGSLLISDDAAGVIYRVTYKKM